MGHSPGLLCLAHPLKRAADRPSEPLLSAARERITRLWKQAWLGDSVLGQAIVREDRVTLPINEVPAG